MEQPDKRILEFIKKHHVLTLATSVDNRPWCANCFYTWYGDENALIFTSDDSTRHAMESVANTFVAGSIVLETTVVGKLQGIQFEGEISKSTDETPQYRNAYLKRFPFAILSSTSIWIVRLTKLKFTDNRLGFGKKLIWEKEREG